MFPKSKLSLGFGLIELIVSLTIVTVVTSMVIARHNVFNSAILLRNQAYEIAFVIHQAQQLAVSGQTSDLSTTQRQRYGVAFSTSASGDVNQQVVILYKDNNNNGLYDSSDTEIQANRLDTRFMVSGLTTSGTGQDSVRIVFERPLFDAKFYQGTSNSTISGPARITIQPVRGTAQRSIVVSASGQVAVE